MSNEVIVAEVQQDEHITTADLVRDSQSSTEHHEALFTGEESGRFRNSWHDIQGSFVDEPRHAVEKADELVATVIKRLAGVFAKEREHVGRCAGEGQ